MNSQWISDQQWVVIEDVRGGLLRSSRVYTAEEGFSLEVFEGKKHRASILLQSEDLPDVQERCESLSVNAGSRILRVSLKSIPLQLTGELQTGDKQKTAYQISLILRVCHPAKFARECYRGGDPLFLAQEAIKGRLSEHVERIDEADLDKYSLRAYVETTLNESSHRYLGLEVVNTGEFNLTQSAHRQSIAEIQQSTELEGYQHEGQMKRVIAEEDIADIRYIRSNRREGAEIRKQQIFDKMKNGRKLTEEEWKSVFGASQVGDILSGPPARPQLRGRRSDEQHGTVARPDRRSRPIDEPYVNADMPRSGRRPVEGFDADTPPHSDRRPVERFDADTPPRAGKRSAEKFSDDRLGLLLKLHTLSESEQKDMELARNTVFKVQWVDEDGPMQEHLQAGDLIIKVAEQFVHDLPTLQQIIDDLIDTGDSFALRISRDEVPLDFSVDL